MMGNKRKFAMTSAEKFLSYYSFVPILNEHVCGKRVIRGSTVARSPGIISTIRTEPRNSGDTNRRKETWSRW